MDTTVILAQPRVPRLRAAVVYVEDRGSVRAPLGMVGQAGDLLCRQSNGTFDPPESGPLIGRFAKTESLSADETWPPKVSPIDTRIFSPIGIWHPCAFDYWTQNLSYGYTKKTHFSQKMPLRAPDIQGIPRG